MDNGQLTIILPQIISIPERRSSTVYFSFTALSDVFVDLFGCRKNYLFCFTAERYTSIPNVYILIPNVYIPIPNAYIPIPNIYIPIPNAYIPISNDVIFVFFAHR
jgi:hypothetical protein